MKLQLSWTTVEVVCYPHQANFMMLSWTPVVSESQIGLASHFQTPPIEQVWIEQCTAGWSRRVDAHFHSWYEIINSLVKSWNYWIKITNVGRCRYWKLKCALNINHLRDNGTETESMNHIVHGWLIDAFSQETVIEVGVRQVVLNDTVYDGMKNLHSFLFLSVIGNVA